jgi:glycolate oxidase FAD binding subunit
VEQLRQRCIAQGGQLSVLHQPPSSSPLPCWDASPASGIIEALKREFDPLQQLGRGRLPGVIQAGVNP